MQQFASLLKDTLKASSCNEKTAKSSNPRMKESPSSAMKQKQDSKKQERLFEKIAAEAEKLIKKYKIDVNQEVKVLSKEVTPVAVVAESGNVPMMEVLIKHGVTLNQEGYTYYGGHKSKAFPVIIVAKSGNVPMMELLIKHGVNLDLKDGKIHVNYETHPSHSAVLNAAAKSGYTSMVELLLKYIPDIDFQRVGTTNIAARRGDLNMLRFLKEQGIPFHSGCLAAVSHQCNILTGCRSKQNTNCPHLMVIQYLLENGFDIKKDRGEALAWACLSGNETMVRFLLEHGAECHIHSAAICPASGSAIVKAGEGGNINVIKMLLAKGANIHDVRKDGKANALHQAANYGKAAIVPFLVQQGIEVNTPNGYGQTPLILAAKFGWLDTVKVLLAQGADASVRDHKGKTAADYALESSNHTKDTLDGARFDKKGAGEAYRLLKKAR